MLFDAVLDTVGEASRAVGLLREGGGLCSIIASPSVEGVRAWVDESKVEPRRVTLGVATFLNSSLGGWAFNAVTGARRLRARCAARGAGYSSVIGTGDGEVAAELGRLLEEGGLEAVLDKAFPLTRCAEAREGMGGWSSASELRIHRQLGIGARRAEAWQDVRQDSHRRDGRGGARVRGQEPRPGRSVAALERESMS
mmetsp:Transcript_1485/g.4354  ORF Transcript_1485/g.4354 Transcript_1485/m.4354 type:complete len:197 (+) Transcript_1485:267-857(+)